MRISGITIPEKKRLEIGLTAVYGVGRPLAKKILDDMKVDHGAKPADLSSEDENKVRKAIEELNIEGELKREKAANIKRLKDVGCYKGMRHSRKLPCRGQRTKTNSRTLKGAKKTMGSGRKKVEKK
ncbi:30S ribosomal protein S13 [Patescibacteria group bacterium]